MGSAPGGARTTHFRSSSMRRGGAGVGWLRRTSPPALRIPHDRLVQAVEERISDRNLLKLLRAMLRAGVMELGMVRGSVTGTPQGGVVSPLLCNVYLHRLDRRWQTRGVG